MQKVFLRNVQIYLDKQTLNATPLYPRATISSMLIAPGNESKCTFVVKHLLQRYNNSKLSHQRCSNIKTYFYFNRKVSEAN